MKDHLHTLDELLFVNVLNIVQECSPLVDDYLPLQGLEDASNDFKQDIFPLFDFVGVENQADEENC